MNKRIPVLFVMAALLATATALSAGAAPVSQPSQAPRIKAKDSTSTNWSGYAVETNLSSPQNNAVSDVKGQWTVPTLQCGSSSTYSSAWVGIDGYSDRTVEQTGTEHDCVTASHPTMPGTRCTPESASRST